MLALEAGRGRLDCLDCLFPRVLSPSLHLRLRLGKVLVLQGLAGPPGPRLVAVRGEGRRGWARGRTWARALPLRPRPREALRLTNDRAPLPAARPFGLAALNYDRVT